MLDTFIIEEIKRREREQAREDRPVLEIPAPAPPPARSGDDDPQRPPGEGTVVIIDYTG